MTINACVRVPDGSVLASDSLATSLQPVQQQLQIGPIKCGECGHETASTMIQTPVIGVPGSSTPLASKLFYIGNYGVTFFGSSAVNSRSLFNHVLVFRNGPFHEEMRLNDIADGLGEQLAEAAANDARLASVAPGTLICGFQICGYDPKDIDIGQNATVSIVAGKGASRENHNPEYGLNVTGDPRVVQMLFQPASGAPTPKPNFQAMTLADAIDYARFIVQTTSDYHRFADMVPTVGGPTEIAVITKWIGFRFIERKKILGDDTTRLNIGKISQEIRSIRADLPRLVRQELAAASSKEESDA